MGNENGYKLIAFVKLRCYRLLNDLIMLHYTKFYLYNAFRSQSQYQNKVLKLPVDDISGIKCIA